jgi:hypothetical protein
MSPFKMGMLMTSSQTMNKKPYVRQTIQSEYNQTSIANTDIHKVQAVRTMSMNNRYSMSNMYNAPRGSGGG